MSSSETAPEEAVPEAPAPVDELREGLVARLAELVPEAVVEHHTLVGKDLWIRVRAEHWVEVGHAVRYVLGAR